MFRTTFLVVDAYTNTNLTFNILGWEPINSTGAPVYLHAGGAGDQLLLLQDPWVVLPENNLPWHMARRGYVAGWMEVPARPVMECNNATNLSLDAVTERLFRYDGPHDNSGSALSVMCHRASADCSRGIAIHGISVSGMLARLVPKYTRHVTAMLIWSSGSFVPFSHSCCGALGGNRSCCRPNQPVGGTFLSCLSSTETTRHFPQSRVRTVITQGDTMYGDYNCDPEGTNLTSMLTACTYDPRSVVAAVNQANNVSGLSCGLDSLASNGTHHHVDCIQPDGSGYVIPSVAEVGGHYNNYMQGHNFFLIGPEDLGGAAQHAGTPTQDAAEEEASDVDYDLNGAWTESDAAWGFRSSFDWLAATARVPLWAAQHRAERTEEPW